MQANAFSWSNLSYQYPFNLAKTTRKEDLLLYSPSKRSTYQNAVKILAEEFKKQQQLTAYILGLHCMAFGRAFLTCSRCLQSSRGGCRFHPRCGNTNLSWHAPSPGSRLWNDDVLPSRSAFIGFIRHIRGIPPPFRSRLHFYTTVWASIWFFYFITRPQRIPLHLEMLFSVGLLENRNESTKTANFSSSQEEG